MHFDRFITGHEPADVPEGHRKLAGGNTPGPSQKKRLRPGGARESYTFPAPLRGAILVWVLVPGVLPPANLHDASGVTKCMTRPRSPRTPCRLPSALRSSPERQRRSILQPRVGATQERLPWDFGKQMSPTPTGL